MKKLILAVSLAITSFSGSALANSIEFNSPSGNILCGGNQNQISCFITESTGKPPLSRPKDCPVDWGQKFDLRGKGKASMPCFGDFEFNPEAPVLQYGQTIRGKSWQCTSTQSGMRCENSSKRGFQLNRQQQILF